MGAESDHRSEAEHDQDPADAVVELRHEAGLTSGQTLALRPGRFRFGPLRSDHGGLVDGTPEAVSFDLAIADDGETTLNAGGEPVAVEGIIVDRAVALDPGDVVQLTTDHFRFESTGATDGPRGTERSVEPRSVAPVEPPSMARWFALCGLVVLVGLVLATASPRFVGLALIGLAGLIAVYAFRSRRMGQLSGERSVAVTNAKSLLFNEVVEVRKAAAAALRAGAPTPAVIAATAANGSDRSGNTLTVTIASGDRAWEPPIVVRRSPGWDYRSVVDGLSFLPAIPFTVDLDVGPVAILGPRAATLSVARHLATTALTIGGDSAGIEVHTDVPADWHWLLDHDNSVLRILDHVEGPTSPRTVFLADSTDDLQQHEIELDSMIAIMEIDDLGRATITAPDGTGGTGFVPHGITEQHARELQQILGREAGRDGAAAIAAADQEPAARPVPAAQREAAADITDIDASHTGATDRLGVEVFDTERLLVTGPDRGRNKNVLATAALHQAARHPDRDLYILDRGDRALIRLAQLDNCERYTTLDRPDDVEELVAELERLTEEEIPGRRLLLAPDLWTTISFYRACGMDRLGERLDALVAEMELLPLAASSTDADHSAAFLVWIDTAHDENAEVHRAEEDGVIDLRSLPGIDLTGSVARLANIARQETGA